MLETSSVPTACEEDCKDVTGRSSEVSGVLGLERSESLTGDIDEDCEVGRLNLFFFVPLRTVTVLVMSILVTSISRTLTPALAIELTSLRIFSRATASPIFLRPCFHCSSSANELPRDTPEADEPCLPSFFCRCLGS